MNPEDPHFGLMMTMIGMGTVFTALILLAVFTYIFKRLFCRGESETVTAEPTPSAPEPPRAAAEPPPAAPVDPVLHAKRKRVAAIAVALLLAASGQVRPLFNPKPGEGRSWRQTYRQRVLFGGRRRR